MKTALTILALALLSGPALAGQAPGAASAPDVPVSGKDRFYTSDQFSNTVSVVDPAANTLLGVIRLGDPTPMNLSPLYRGQLLVHGMGFSPDHRTLLAVSIGSNSVSFIDTATNAVRHTAYVGRSPHEAFFTPDGREVWVRRARRGPYRGARCRHRQGDPPDHRTERARHDDLLAGRHLRLRLLQLSPETVVIDTKTHTIVGRVKQESPFCPDIAATPDGKQVWFTLKDVGRTQVFSARPPFAPLKTIETGPITNHVNIVSTKAGQFAYVTIGGLNQVKVFAPTTSLRSPPSRPAPAARALALGRRQPRLCRPGERRHGGGDRHRSNTVIAEVPVGQGPQGVAYVPNAVPEGDGKQNLQPLGAAGKTSALTLAGSDCKPATQVTLFDQGVLQTLQAAVTGLPPKMPFVLALAADPKGSDRPGAARRLHDQPGRRGHRQRDRSDPTGHPHGCRASRRRYLVLSRASPVNSAVSSRCRLWIDRVGGASSEGEHS